MSKVQKAIEKLERQNCMVNNICPQGHRWCIFNVFGTALVEIAPGKESIDPEDGKYVMEPDRNVRMPESLVSKYTGSWRAQEAIESYLNKMWDLAENPAAAAKEGSKKADNAPAPVKDQPKFKNAHMAK